MQNWVELGRYGFGGIIVVAAQQWNEKAGTLWEEIGMQEEVQAVGIASQNKPVSPILDYLYGSSLHISVTTTKLLQSSIY